jgi:hypothetical protein
MWSIVNHGAHCAPFCFVRKYVIVMLIVSGIVRCKSLILKQCKIVREFLGYESTSVRI